MTKKSAHQSAFFNRRVLISLAFGAISALLTLLAFGLYPGATVLAQGQQQDRTQTQGTSSVPAVFGVPTGQADSFGGCSFSNGGLNPHALTESGVAAPAGFFWSELQHNSNNTFEANTLSGFQATQGSTRLADDFSLTGTCTLNNVVFYAFQNGAPASPSPFTGYTLRIHNGQPGDPGVTVVFGDTTTNRLVSSVDSTYYRIFNTVVPAPGSPPSTTRKIWKNTVSIGTTLPAGHYWLDWAATVSGGGNNFHPAKTFQGFRGAGNENGRQLTVASGVWDYAIDFGIPVDALDYIQDFPFDLNGMLPPALGNYPSTSLPLSTDTTVTPDVPPTSTTSINVSTSTNFKGRLEGDPATGVVRVTDAHPAGVYTVTVKAFLANSGGASATTTFTLTVTTPVPCAPVSFAAPTANVSAGNRPRSNAVGDFNGDGKQDLAVANFFSNDVSILLGDGAGHFSAATNFGAGNRPDSVAVGDFNNDGKEDLAVANFFSNDVSILLGDGAGNFSAATNIGAGFSCTSVAVGDFNGDSKQDLVVGNNGSGNVSILLGDGAGNFSIATNFATGGGPASVAVGDFNGDGKQDLATANDGSANVSILLGNGAGSFGAATNFGAGGFPYSVAVGDFNADGKQDLAVANQTANVSILLGNGAGSFSAATNFAAGTNPYSVAIGDFNGDGKQDLAAANFTSNDVSILLGNGAGSFGAAANFGAGSNPYSVAVGDFNGDGKQDLAVANFSSNNVSILLRDCAVTYTLTYTAGAHGTISGTTPQTVVSGGSGTPVTAVPNTGYHFVNWSDSSTANPRTDTNVMANLSVTANFAINTYTLTYAAGPNGTISGTTPQTVSYGASGTAVTAVPNASYHFVNWSDSSTANPRTDMNVMANISVTANFAINTYTLTYTAGANGTISGTTPQTVVSGGSGTPVTAVPNTGYHFVNWSDSSTANPRTDANVVANISVTATFAINTYTVTYDANGGTGTQTDPNNPHNYNSTVTVLGPGAITRTGYTFTNWNTAANGSGTSFNPGASFNIALDVTLYAQWTLTPILGNYPNTSVPLSTGATVAPDASPVNTMAISVSTDSSFQGTFAASPTSGVVRVINAHPAGVYLVTVKALPGGTTKAFTLTVTNGCMSAASFTNAADVTVGTGPYAVAIGDFNGDGKQDLAVANGSATTVSIRLGDGLGGFNGSTNVNAGSAPHSVAVGDFNGDGKQDLALANYSDGTVSIRLGDGIGGFSGSTEVGVGSHPQSVAVGDFNGDGKQDLAVANFLSDTVSIRLGDGMGGFSGSTEVSVGLSPYSVAIGDFNGDGKLDFATANLSGNTASIRLGDGIGGFSGSTEVDVGSGPASVAIGDFNGDGKQDLAVANLNSLSTSVRLGDGIGGFSGSTEVSVGSHPSSVAIGDFNGDGKQDLAIANNSANTVSIRLGNGSGGFSSSTDLSAGPGPQSVAIGDFNGDGKQDLAVANHDTDTVSIRLGQCSSPLALATAVSRKTHGSAGTFDIPLPLTGTPGVECRSSGNHTLVFTASNNLVSGNASVTTGTGSISGSPTFSGNTMTVNLTGVTDVQKITVTLSNVTDGFAQVLPDTAVSMNVLAGDINGNKAVSTTDIAQVKALAGVPVDAANFRADVAANGAINTTDIALVKSRSGQTVP